jgi:DNA-binding response OmpR family regulator
MGDALSIIYGRLTTGNKFAESLSGMEDTARPSSGRPAPWEYSSDADTLGMAGILVVEDDRDIRDLLSTLLDMAGFAVVSCDSAEAGLDALREQEFDLILTDYALPGHSGLWLLEHAEAEGLVQGTPVMIVTAHPAVAARPYEVIQKPFDLDDLIEKVRYRVEGDGPRRRRAPSTGRPCSGHDESSRRAPEGAGPVELILYVSAETPQSSAAVNNVKKVLARLPASRVRLTVHDLSLDPSPGEDAAGIMPGTLVRKTKGPRTYIMGHISNPELLLELLADCDPGS